MSLIRLVRSGDAVGIRAILSRHASSYIVAQGGFTTESKPRREDKASISPQLYRISSDGVVLQPLAPEKAAVTKMDARRFVSRFASYLLPAGYPSSVAPAYTHYASWSFVAMAFSSAGGVLSMQSLLYAVGIGSGSLPLAAALNWVIKDGLGQLGGVLYAALVNTKFDSDPKRWRFISAMASDAATALEVCTPLFPAAFLPMAAVANIGKNVAWLSASATRAGLHQALAVSGNLADVTGRAGSQSIAAASIGTLLGVALSPLIGADTLTLMGAFGMLSAAHLSCVYVSLRGLPLPTLNSTRLAHAVLPAIDEGIAIYRGMTQGADGVDPALKFVEVVPDKVRSPADVGPRDAFLPWSRPHPLDTGAGATEAASSPAAQSFNSVTIHTGTELAAFPLLSICLDDPDVDPARRLQFELSAKRYVVGVSQPRPGTPPAASAAVVSAAGPAPAGPIGVARNPASVSYDVHVLYAHDAGWREVLTGHVHALFLARLLAMRPVGSAPDAPGSSGTGAFSSAPGAVHSGGGIGAPLFDAEFLAEFYARAILAGLEKAGWWVGTPLLEDLGASRRVRVTQEGGGDGPAAEAASPAKAEV